MLLSHLIIIILVVVVFCLVVQYTSNLYVCRKLQNQGADIESAKNIAQSISILMTIFYGIFIFVLICIATQTLMGV